MKWLYSWLKFPVIKKEIQKLPVTLRTKVTIRVRYKPGNAGYCPTYNTDNNTLDFII